jgi:hypothetical protein
MPVQLGAACQVVAAYDTGCVVDTETARKTQLWPFSQPHRRPDPSATLFRIVGALWHVGACAYGCSSTTDSSSTGTAAGGAALSAQGVSRPWPERSVCSPKAIGRATGEAWEALKLTAVLEGTKPKVQAKTAHAMLLLLCTLKPRQNLTLRTSFGAYVAGMGGWSAVNS